jgi:hypothetical protein
MTNTEQRLADALRAVARSVREETLPSLQAPAPRRGRRWAIRLAPAFAAAGVALAVLISLLVSHTGPPAPPVTGAPPVYYAAMTAGSVQIRSTATGKLTGTARVPSGWTAAAEAAASNGTTFFVACNSTTIGGADQTKLYSFEITSSGQVTGFAPVKDGTFDNALTGSAMAVSPDGSQVAFSIAEHASASATREQSGIEIIDPGTGARQLRSGGLAHAGTLYLPSLSWNGNGSLVFLAQWCDGQEFLGVCLKTPSGEQVRTLDPAGRGSLGGSSVLFSSSASYPYIGQALVSDGGSALILAAMAGSSARDGDPKSFQVLQVPIHPAGSPQLLYQGRVNGLALCLRSDASGQHLILAAATNGWLDHGQFRPLPPQGSGLVYCNTW